MFEFLKENTTTLVLKLSYTIPYGKSWWSKFSHSCSSEHETELMFAHLKEYMDNAIIKARQDAYNEGWADKSAKRTKKTWFSCKI